ncbi:MAG: hypothetical protein RLY95_1534 [Pseudomonadota bacterium]|jgi:hypothetical protein
MRNYYVNKHQLTLCKIHKCSMCISMLNSIIKFIQDCLHEDSRQECVTSRLQFEL